MTTNNQVDVGLSGATGTGNFVGTSSPTLVGPTLGDATATSLTFNPTTSGIVGTTTNNNAAAGKVGEYISSLLPKASAIGATSTMALDITNIALTAGDWEVQGSVFTSAAVGTTTSSVSGWASTTSATAPTAPNNGCLYLSSVALPASQNFGAPTGPMRLSLSGNTTVYLSGVATFAVSTLGIYGFIGARRMR